MSSTALSGLYTALNEIRDLQAANPTPPGKLPRAPNIVRAINRSSVVLLCSHLERYIRAINEETVHHINSNNIDANKIPLILRLRYSRNSIDEIANTQWDNRSDKLREFANNETWLWAVHTKTNIDHTKLLKWMKSPDSKSIMKFYKMWGIDDIFSLITTKATTRTELWLKIQELVEKRNNIAHGDSNTEATYKDIKSYLQIIEKFCERSDRALSRTIIKVFDLTSAW